MRELSPAGRGQAPGHGVLGPLGPGPTPSGLDVYVSEYVKTPNLDDVQWQIPSTPSWAWPPTRPCSIRPASPTHRSAAARTPAASVSAVDGPDGAIGYCRAWCLARPDPRVRTDSIERRPAPALAGVAFLGLGAAGRCGYVAVPAPHRPERKRRAALSDGVDTPPESVPQTRPRVDVLEPGTTIVGIRFRPGVDQRAARTSDVGAADQVIERTGTPGSHGRTPRRAGR